MPDEPTGLAPGISEVAQRLDDDLTGLVAIADDVPGAHGVNLLAMGLARQQVIDYVDTLATSTVSPFAASEARDAAYVLRGLFSHWVFTVEVDAIGPDADDATARDCIRTAYGAHLDRTEKYLRDSLVELEALNLARARTE